MECRKKGALPSSLERDQPVQNRTMAASGKEVDLNHVTRGGDKMGPRTGDKARWVMKDRLIEGQMCHLKDWIILGRKKSL